MSSTIPKKTQSALGQIDARKISSATEQLFYVSRLNADCGILKQPSTSLSTDVKSLLKIVSSYATEPFFKGNSEIDMDASLLFFDSRKQKLFDWVKNRNAYQRIIHLSDLDAGWDGYEAPTFSKEQIDRALTLYSGLRTYFINKGLDFSKIEPFIAPGSDGSILFEWAGKRFPGKQLEVYIPACADRVFEYLKTEGEFEEEGKFDLNGLGSILDWLFKFDC